MNLSGATYVQGFGMATPPSQQSKRPAVGSPGTPASGHQTKKSVFASALAGNKEDQPTEEPMDELVTDEDQEGTSPLIYNPPSQFYTAQNNRQAQN